MGETDEEETWMRDYDSYFACLPCAGVDEELVNSLKVDSENGKLALTMKVCSLALSHSSPSLIRSLSLSLPPRQYPHLFPVLKKCTVESTRAAMERAYASRCQDVNTKLFEEILSLRQSCVDEREKTIHFFLLSSQLCVCCLHGRAGAPARLPRFRRVPAGDSVGALGISFFFFVSKPLPCSLCHLRSSPRLRSMAKTPERVLEFLNDLRDRLEPLAQADYAQLLGLKRALRFSATHFALSICPSLSLSLSAFLSRLSSLSPLPAMSLSPSLSLSH